MFDPTRNKEAKFETIKPSAQRLAAGSEGSYTLTSSYTLTWSDGWRLQFYLNDKPNVAVESRKIAELFAKDRPDQAIIADCDKRVEIWSDDDDEMIHFNDFVFIQEAFCKVPHAYVWEAAGGTFQN